MKINLSVPDWYSENFTEILPQRVSYGENVKEKKCEIKKDSSKYKTRSLACSELTVDEPPVDEVRARLRFFDHVLNEAADLLQVGCGVYF